MLRFYTAIATLALCQMLSFSDVRAGDLDDIGLTALLADHPWLNGSGITVGIAEAPASVQNPPPFHFNPDGTAWSGSTPVWFFDIDGGEYTTTPSVDAHQYNAAQASGHAGYVAINFALTAPGVSKVESFEANYFVGSIIAHVDGSNNWDPIPVQSQIINQSYVYLTTDPQEKAEVELVFDAYANEFGTLFVSGGNNGSTSVGYAPGTMHNGLAVGRSDGFNSAGIHVVAPSGFTSYATPYVSGSAALLLQSATETYGAASDAVDSRVIKSLIINGANKTPYADWGDGSALQANGLDTRYGSGLLNVNTSHQILSQGRLTASTSTDPVLNGLAGWDLNTLTVGTSNSYFFDIDTNGSHPYSLTATLTWNSITTDITYSEGYFSGLNEISDFSLSLWSLVDDDWVLLELLNSDSNVEHLYLTGLLAGSYEIRVTLDALAPNQVGISDTYALAFLAVPEPSSAALFIFGLVGCFLRRSR
jgi:hypothetical protein